MVTEWDERFFSVGKFFFSTSSVFGNFPLFWEENVEIINRLRTGASDRKQNKTERNDKALFNLKIFFPLLSIGNIFQTENFQSCICLELDSIPCRPTYNRKKSVTVRIRLLFFSIFHSINRIKRNLSKYTRAVKHFQNNIGYFLIREQLGHFYSKLPI